MTQPGWYQHADGSTLYWNGSQWLAPAGRAAEEPSFVKRKNRIVPGIFLLLASLLVGAAAFQPWITVGLPGFTITKSWITAAIDPQFAIDGSFSSLRELVVAGAAVCALLAVLMLWTRRRGWGPVLRLLYALPWLASTALCVYWWRVAGANLSESVGKDDALGQAAAGIMDTMRTLGVYRVDPALGLYLWAAGSLLGLVGLVVPGILYEVRVPRR